MSTTLERDTASLRKQIRDLEAKMRQPAGMRDELSAIQHRYDQVDAMFGDYRAQSKAVMGPVPGETPLEYRQRRLKDFTQYSPQYKNARVHALGEDVIGGVEAQVLQDAAKASYDPANYKPNTINPVTYRDSAGRECTRWVGSGWFGDFFSLQGVGGRIRDPHDPKDNAILNRDY